MREHGPDSACAEKLVRPDLELSPADEGDINADCYGANTVRFFGAWPSSPLCSAALLPRGVTSSGRQPAGFLPPAPPNPRRNWEPGSVSACPHDSTSSA